MQKTTEKLAQYVDILQVQSGLCFSSYLIVITAVCVGGMANNMDNFVHDAAHISVSIVTLSMLQHAKLLKYSIKLLIM